MTRLAQDVVGRLRADRINPDLVEALADAGFLQWVNGRSFAVPCVRPDGSEATHFWSVEGEPEPWLVEETPAVWWPLGKDGSTVIVVVGVRAGLVLASLLYRVVDGDLKRRPNLPGLLADAVPLVLPETHPDLSVWWLLDDSAPGQLVDELAAAGCRLAFLALIAKAPDGLAFAEFPVEVFADECRERAPEGLTVVPALLSRGHNFPGLIAAFRGHGARHALAGVLAFCRQAAFDPCESQR